MGPVSELRVIPVRYDVKDGNKIKNIYRHVQRNSLEGWTSFNELLQWKKNYVATIGNASLVTILLPPLPCISLMHLLAKFCSFSACLVDP